MRAKIRQILEECIETGIESGYLRAHKSNDNPYAFHIYEQIEDAIWFEIDQRFVFDNEPDEDYYPRGVCTEVVKGFDQLATMPRKCIVKDCENHTDQGGFTGDLCNPCYEFISKGKGVHSQAYRNAQRKWVGLTWDEMESIIEHFHTPMLPSQLCRAIEAKLKELNT